MTKGWIRVWRAANLLDCSRDHVYDLVNSGELEAIKIGPRGLRVSRESLETFIVQNMLADPTTDKKN